MTTTNDARGRRFPMAWLVLTIGLGLVLGSGTGASADDEAVDPARYQEQSLRVSLWLNKDSDEVYRRGEPLNVTFQTNEDAYAVLYRIDAEGRVSVLWPTSRYSDGFVFGGHRYRLPSRGGEQLRTVSAEGQGFLHAVVSQYPFDLRDLELDFHHEPVSQPHDFYVAGDPYLAMNEVNYVVTGLEDPSAYAVSNYVMYYVHRPVDHPRYLCFQCHDGDQVYDPYRDTCTIDIEYDYGWHNAWWDRYEYYPVYYYPAFVYVDPWAGVRWANYWYDPWYAWPASPWYRWNYQCYVWDHSPYWRHDVHAARKDEHRRYRPLDRRLVDERDGSRLRTKSALVRDRAPGDERIRAMKDRTRLATARSGPDTRDRVRGAGGRLGSDRAVREQTRFEPPAAQGRDPGLRVRPGTSRVGAPERTPAERTRDGFDRKPSRPTRPSDDRVRTPTRGGDRTRVTPRDRRDETPSRSIRPVQPRTEQRRVWSNRRSTPSQPSRPSSPPSTRPARPAPRKPEIDRSRSGSSSQNRGSAGSSVRQRAPSKPRSTPKPPPSRPKSSGSSKQKSRAKSGGGHD
jgi:hypothetical protein